MAINPLSPQAVAFGATPSITNSTYSNALYDGTCSALGLVSAQPTTAAGTGTTFGQPKRVAPIDKDFFSNAMRELNQNKQPENQMTKRRIIKVIIVDTDENVPLDKCILYSGEEKMTDATDQELFFEIDIKNILDKHNEYRVTLKDKSVKERIENLEPVKIRDLRMVVVNVATF